MPTRRSFLVSLPALLPAVQAFGQSFSTLPKLRHKKTALPPAPLTVYFGTDTSKGVSKGIYQATFDTVKGQLTIPVLAVAAARPGFLAISRPGANRRLLYAANSSPDDSSAVSTFSVDEKTGALHTLGHTPAGGANPAYISVDDTSRALFAADYTGGTVASFRIQPDGTLSQPVDRIDMKDAKQFGAMGPNTNRQKSSHPHCATISPDNRFLLVCDLGTDQISVFLIHPETGQLTNHKLFSNRPGSGPRHIAFHPNGRWVYCINELDSTIDRYLWTATEFSEIPEGRLVNASTPIRTTAPEFTGTNTAAELSVSPDGSYLYASNRGEDTLVVYTISPRDGALKLLQRISCGGKTPRFFTLDPTAQWLLCGNQDSASITVFHRNGSTGLLTGPNQTIPIDSPMHILFG